MKKDMKKKSKSKHRTRRERYHQKRPKQWLGRLIKLVLLIALTCLVAIVAYGASLVIRTNNLMSGSYVPRSSNRVATDKIDVMKDPISILLLGVDNNAQRGMDTTRTDSILLLTINPSDEQIKMVSIPRDTYTQINADNFEGFDKINAAFAYGGIDTTIDAVENLMNVPITYYATLDFRAFEEIVDAVGGIKVDIPFDIMEMNSQDKVKVHLREGRHLLKGEEALAFARTRKIDNDIERGGRQQQVLQAVVEKAMSVGSIAKYKNILQALDGHIQTDMPMNNILSLAQSGLSKDYQFETYTFSWISFDYYQQGNLVNMVGLHQDSLDFISHRMRLSLGLTEPDERDESGFKFESDGIVSPLTFPNDGLAVVN